MVVTIIPHLAADNRDVRLRLGCAPQASGPGAPDPVGRAPCREARDAKAASLARTVFLGRILTAGRLELTRLRLKPTSAALRRIFVNSQSDSASRVTADHTRRRRPSRVSSHAFSPLRPLIKLRVESA